MAGPPFCKAAPRTRLAISQPTRTELIAKRGTKALYQYNGIASWGVAENGEVKHVYA
jgi:sulfane dehydrogenase subunit SoxC